MKHPKVVSCARSTFVKNKLSCYYSEIAQRTRKTSQQAVYFTFHRNSTPSTLRNIVWAVKIFSKLGFPPVFRSSTRDMTYIRTEPKLCSNAHHGELLCILDIPPIGSSYLLNRIEGLLSRYTGKNVLSPPSPPCFPNPYCHVQHPVSPSIHVLAILYMCSRHIWSCQTLLASHINLERFYTERFRLHGHVSTFCYRIVPSSGSGLYVLGFFELYSYVFVTYQ